MPITITQKSPRGARPGLSQNADATAQDRAQMDKARQAARFAPSRAMGAASPVAPAPQPVAPPVVTLPKGPTSAFFRWLVLEHNAGHAKFRRMRNQAGTVALEITMSMSVARRFSLGTVAGEPFIGLQQRDLEPLASVDWNAVELRQSRYQSRMVLVGKFGDNNVRLVLPANPMSVREFIDPADRHLDLRKVTVAAHGRVSRINRHSIANLRLVRRALLAGAAAPHKKELPAATQKRVAAISRAALKTNSNAGSFWQKLFG